MKKLFTIILLLAVTASFAQLEGTTWKLSPEAGALAVGPEIDNWIWWTNSAGDVVTRACYFDDEYVFGEDGTFSNVQQTESWIESWQGMDPEACGSPVAPHNGAAATWTYDAGAGTLTLNGVGAYLGLAKVFNDGELSSEGTVPPESITYMVEFNADADTMTVLISIGSGYWQYILTTNAGNPPPPADDISLPVTFNNPALDYRLTDFGGTTSTIIEDPTDASNMVCQTVRSDVAETWAGTTVAEPSGLVPAIPFTAELTQMRMRVYSPEAGIPILFKIEVHDNTGVFVEVTSNTTVANEWETIYFDFAEFLDLANAYNKPVVFFNFGAAGADVGEMIFYWDDIEFVNPEGVFDNEYNAMKVYPNPATDRISIQNSEELSNIRIYSVIGSLVYESENVSRTIDISSLNKGVYSIQATGENGELYSTKIIVN